MAHIFICKRAREQYWMNDLFLGWSTAANGSNGLGRSHNLGQEVKRHPVQVNLKVKSRQADYNVPRISSGQTRGLTFLP